MQVSGSLAMTTQRSGERRNFVVVGRERSAFAVCTQVLTRIKTERGGMSEPANSLPAVSRPVRLACILDQQQSVIGCDFSNGTEVCRPAIQMHGNDGTSSFGNCLFNLCGINVCCCGINVSKDRSRSHIADRFDCRNKRICAGDDFIALPHSRREQRQVQSARPRVQADTVLYAAVFSKCVFKLLYFFTQYESCFAADSINGGSDLFTQITILRGQIKKGNFELSLHVSHRNSAAGMSI